ncbi:hypothetical protein OF829_00455 [Sphingomonas sp. LB-2]|uniref:hypothetical protein n=1 Tax=Sphingomonas caeni TaxID=2984949 RepID=UPI00222FB64D|nr:hypothetical protein [Sphingomonas caeni]MCW3845691.1 hypothetical protein [Sphingomonas caeni]
MATISFIFSQRSTKTERAKLLEEVRGRAGVLDVSWLMEDAADPELARTALAEVRDDAMATLVSQLRAHRMIETVEPPARRYLV